MIVPSLVIGVPLGAWIIRHIDAETFRRVCMSFDAWVVGFGISSLLRLLHLVDGYAAYSVMAAVIAIDAVLLYRFFSGHRRARVDVARLVSIKG
jgi:mannitol-specific phosphotransferase system IIBC component